MLIVIVRVTVRQVRGTDMTGHGPRIIRRPELDDQQELNGADALRGTLLSPSSPNY